MRCRQRWEWAWVNRYRSKRVSTPLAFGSLIHDCLEPYYPPGKKRGVHPVETLENIWDETIGGMYDEDGVWLDAKELATDMLNNYIEVYGKDERYEIIAPEMPFQVEVYDEDDAYCFTYVGQIDATAIDLKTKQIVLLEH